MKRIILTITTVLSLTSLFSQAWIYAPHKNKFEGVSFEVAAAYGDGDFPYNSPILAVRKSEKTGVEIMMSGVGYATAERTRIKYYFDDGEPETIRISTSTDGQTYFLYLDNQTEFINKLKTGSKVYFRAYTGTDQKDYTFSLSGSTAAINKLGL